MAEVCFGLEDEFAIIMFDSMELLVLHKLQPKNLLSLNIQNMVRNNSLRVQQLCLQEVDGY